MTDDARDMPDVGELSDGMKQLLDAYESRYLLASQSTELDVLSWSNGVEIMLKEIVTQIGRLTIYTASLDH